MPKGKLTPEGEIIAAYGAAMVAAFQVLNNCLEESDALLPGQFPDALGVYMEMVKSRKGDVSDMTLAVLHDIRAATLDWGSTLTSVLHIPNDARQAVDKVLNPKDFTLNCF
jgi:hypothetical protein